MNSRRVLAIAVPQATTGVVALLCSFLGFLAGEQGTVPWAVLIVVLVQLVGYAVTRGEEPAALRRSWVVGLVAIGVVLPLLAVQITLARQPYIGTAVGSSLPLLAATVGAALILMFTAVTLAAKSFEAPEEAGLLLMPLALLVPTTIGIRSDVTEASAVQAVGEAGLLAAAASALAWSLPRQSRLLVPPIALAVQFILLWMIGRGPSYEASSGGVVPLTQSGLLALVVVLVVAAPILAFWVRRAHVAGESRARRIRLPDIESFG